MIGCSEVGIKQDQLRGTEIEESIERPCSAYKHEFDLLVIGTPVTSKLVISELKGASPYHSQTN